MNRNECEDYLRVPNSGVALAAIDDLAPVVGASKNHLPAAVITHPALPEAQRDSQRRPAVRGTRKTPEEPCNVEIENCILSGRYGYRIKAGQYYI